MSKSYLRYPKLQKEQTRNKANQDIKYKRSEKTQRKKQQRKSNPLPIPPYILYHNPQTKQNKKKRSTSHSLVRALFPNPLYNKSKANKQTKTNTLLGKTALLSSSLLLPSFPARPYIVS